jgi:hypothetical protein
VHGQCAYCGSVVHAAEAAAASCRHWQRLMWQLSCSAVAARCTFWWQQQQWQSISSSMPQMCLATLAAADESMYAANVSTCIHCCAPPPALLLCLLLQLRCAHHPHAAARQHAPVQLHRVRHHRQTRRDPRNIQQAAPNPWCHAQQICRTICRYSRHSMH